MGKAGFFKDEVDLHRSLIKLDDCIINVPALYKNFSNEELLFRKAPGKWSRKEILGHLIDSAINNLKRFTEIRFFPQPYVIHAYQQDQLVRVNNYQEASLEQLLSLWEALNRQIVYLVKNIPAEELEYPVKPQYENDEIKSFGWIIADYVSHLEHHLTQL